MNTGDLQLMNRDQGDGFNLAVGEPRFLQEGFDTLPFRLGVEEAMLSYPNAEGDRVLLDELSWIYPGKYVIITNGAKGGLMAAYHALTRYWKPWAVKSLNDVYWPTHPTLAHLNGLRWLAQVEDNNEYDDEALYLVTGPNNPDGKHFIPKRKVDIWDAAYASPIYGWDGSIPDHRLSVWSLAKRMGLSGLRVGWIVTGDKDLYDAARLYMEKTSSGVSRLSQSMAAKFLRNFRAYAGSEQMYNSTGRARLQQNADVLMDQLAPLFVSVRGANQGPGMYLWAQLLEPEKFHLACTKAGVHVLRGATCGASDEYVRISCGQTQDINKAASLALRTAYDTI